MHYFSLTLIGQDRIGIVAQVTEILFRRGCNIADSSCTLLGGQFAMILIISHPDIDSMAGFGNAFEPLEAEGLAVSLRPLPPGGEQPPCLPGTLCLISVYGCDKPGIVYPVVRELGDHQINITDLNTKLVGTAKNPVYVMMIEVVLPPQVSLEDLAGWMTALRASLQVDISVRDITPVEF